jgi:hypothetical protein
MRVLTALPLAAILVAALAGNASADPPPAATVTNVLCETKRFEVPLSSRFFNPQTGDVHHKTVILHNHSNGNTVTVVPLLWEHQTREETCPQLAGTTFGEAVLRESCGWLQLKAGESFELEAHDGFGFTSGFYEISVMPTVVGSPIQAVVTVEDRFYRINPGPPASLDLISHAITEIEGGCGSF